MNFSPHALDWLEKNLGVSSHPIEISRLTGGVSSSVLLVKCGFQSAVLRLYDNAEWLREEADLPVHECAALHIAARGNVAVPHVLALETSGEIFGIPALLMTHLLGKIELAPRNLGAYCEELARVLAQIHAMEAPDFRWHFRSWTDGAQINVPSWAHQPHLWRAALQLWRSGAGEGNSSVPHVFLHRDFHPLNLLWESGRICGVVDWPNACLGPRGVDVAHARINLAMLWGMGAADEFLAAYRRLVPGWEWEIWFDLDALWNWAWPTPQFYAPWADFGIEPLEQEATNARCEAFLKAILAQI